MQSLNTLSVSIIKYQMNCWSIDKSLLCWGTFLWTCNNQRLWLCHKHCKLTWHRSLYIYLVLVSWLTFMLFTASLNRKTNVFWWISILVTLKAHLFYLPFQIYVILSNTCFVSLSLFYLIFNIFGINLVCLPKYLHPPICFFTYQKPIS